MSDTSNITDTGDAGDTAPTFSTDSPIEAGNDVLRQLQTTHDPDHVVVALSGGHDSTTTLKFALESPYVTVDEAVHMDTGIGLQMTADYVETICEQWGVDLTVLDENNARDSSESYPHLVRTFGFPGAHPASHAGMWQNLKNKPRERYRQSLDGTVAFISGVRKHESTTRYNNLPESGIGEVGSTLWASPLIEFTKEDLEAYRDQHNIPRNDAYSILHASGECLCGAYEDRHNLPFIRTVEPETARQIDRLEFDCIELAARGELPAERVLWANGSVSSGEYAARTDEKQADLGLECRNCEEQCPDSPYQRDGTALSPAEQFLNTHSLHDYWSGRTFYCAVCDEIVDDPFGHRKNVHPFDADTGLASEWGLRMIKPGASMECGHPITEPNGWKLDINQLTAKKSEAENHKHRYYHADYELELCHRQQYRDTSHSWKPYNEGPTRVCTNCGAFGLSDHDIDDPGPPTVAPSNRRQELEAINDDQFTLTDY